MDITYKIWRRKISRLGVSLVLLSYYTSKTTIEREASRVDCEETSENPCRLARLCSTVSASNKWREAADLWQNERIMLTHTGPAVDAIVDVLYHASCYRDFTHKGTLGKLWDLPVESLDVYADTSSMPRKLTERQRWEGEGEGEAARPPLQN